MKGNQKTIKGTRGGISPAAPADKSKHVRRSPFPATTGITGAHHRSPVMGDAAAAGFPSSGPGTSWLNRVAHGSGRT
ncbi:hypothetical protein, partial [Streptomyces platensis]|uniref:hypothetical protein n=1 Tax=Streptomyces platensis TaxID=58346 RepID=UPI001F230C4D